jgi:branched-chain amino acid transport system ATP-binding protein
MSDPAGVSQGSRTGSADRLMSVSGITKSFGAFKALEDISFTVEAGEILGVAGPNGAGKSTLLNVCTGLMPPDKGSIVLGDRRTDRWPPHRLCHAGVARTFQIPQVFESLTVYENIETGGWFGTRDRPQVRRAHAERILDLLGLAGHRHRAAGSTDLLTRKMTMLGAALATGPRLLFMDEPFGGLNADEIEAYAELVFRLRQELGMSLVIVEHKIRALARLSSRLMILNFGAVLCLGAVQDVLNNTQVIDIYLGASGRVAS